jgi:neutral ceramidase
MMPGIVGFGRRHAEMMVDEVDSHSFDSSIPLPVQVWTIAGAPKLQIVFCGGEVVSGYAVVLRSRHGGSGRLWFNGYSNEIPAYIPSDELLDHPCYAGGIDMDAPGIAGGSMTVYKHFGHFLRKAGPNAPDGVEQLLLARLESML